VADVGTVAVDFDGVIHAYSKGWRDGSIYDEPVPGALDALHALMREHAVFIHTTRDARQVARWIEDRTGYGIECVTRVSLLPWKRTFWNVRGLLLVTNRKLPAVAYIDDRAIEFTSWNLALALLKARTGAGAPPAAESPKTGLDRAAEAVRAARGGDAPVQFRGFA
jgi:hypothetical protein